jgi:hypothetical protein
MLIVSSSWGYSRTLKIRDRPGRLEKRRMAGRALSSPSVSAVDPKVNKQLKISLTILVVLSGKWSVSNHAE